MPQRNWNRLQPTSISQAMELCLLHARERHNRSVDRVADLMGLTSKWVIYKWVENGRIPAILIRPYEHACGIDYLTRYLAHSGHKLLINIPTGRKTDAHDMNHLQASCTEAISLLLKFTRGDAEAADTLAALTGVMEEFGWHRGNVEKSARPEFEFDAVEDHSQGGTL